MAAMGGGGAQPPAAPQPPQGGAPNMPGAGTNAPKPGGPAGAPMSNPQQKEGLKAAAATNVHIAVNMLEEALPAFGSESKEGEAILKALAAVSKLVAKRDSSDLAPAEIRQMVASMPQMGGGTDVQKQILKMMSQPQGAPQPGGAPMMPGA